MPRKQKKFHFIYKTTNRLNEKFYVGMHSTNNLEDGYLGSGKRLWYSIQKYGLENHECEILEFLPSREDLKGREAEIINEELLANPLCMNLKFGGEGGWDHINNGETWFGVGNLKNPNIREKTFEARKLRLETDEDFRQREKAKAAKAFEKYRELYPRSAFFGRNHTEETKEKMRKSKNVGETNSQFGTCWIFNEVETKKIKREELQIWLDLGWSKGRKQKFKAEPNSVSAH